MGIFSGISLVGADWCFAQLETSSDVAIPAETQRLPDGFHSQTILRNLERATSLHQRYFTTQADRAQVARNEDYLCADAAQIIRNAAYRYYTEHHDEVERVGTIGIAHPYGLSPVIRRALPAMIGRPIVPHWTDRNERSMAFFLKSSDTAERACAVELPFAVSLQLMARHNVRPPALIVVPGEAGNGVEVAVVSVTAQETTWRLAVEEYFVGSASEANAWLRRPGDWMAKYRPKNAELIVAEFTELEGCDCASLTNSSAWTQSRTVNVEPTDTASGAALYAALCAGEKAGVIVANGIEKIEFGSIAPFPIGVCGQDRRGKIQWCPLFEPGDSLEINNQRSIRFAGEHSIPPRLILAECVQRNRCPGEWVTDSTLLRWYAEVPVFNVPPDTCEGSIDITIESSTECWAYGWSDPFIRGSFVAATN